MLDFLNIIRGFWFVVFFLKQSYYVALSSLVYFLFVVHFGLEPYNLSASASLMHGYKWTQPRPTNLDNSFFHGQVAVARVEVTTCIFVFMTL